MTVSAAHHPAVGPSLSAGGGQLILALLPLLLTSVSASPQDTVTPEITSPTSAETYYAGPVDRVVLKGTVRGPVFGCNWVNWNGGRGEVIETPNWSTPEIALVIGENRIGIYCLNDTEQGADNITVISSELIPTVTILAPTSADVYHAGSASSVTVSGAASRDAVSCAWSSSSGERGSVGAAASWSVRLPLSVGPNVLTVSCVDRGGRRSMDVITVIRSDEWSDGDS